MFTTGDGRTLGYDDFGDPGGRPVVYLHGTPDSRLARHPDDSLAAAAGVRLVAVDRPGYGDSSGVPGGAPQDALKQFAGDVAGLLDQLGIDRVAVLAWSGGALPALDLVHHLGARAERLTVVAGLVPREAYGDADVVAAAPGRVDLFGLADDVSPDQLGEMVAPMLAPYPCDEVLAAEHQRGQRDPATQAAVEQVPGAAEQMAAGLAAAVRNGLDGVALDVVTQNTLGTVVAPGGIECPVDLWYGTEDQLTPPAFGRWLDARLPECRLHIVEDAGHMLLLTHWAEILSSLVE
jgi:pimeloyl-ACP methyl ester carboxylesterase